MSICPKCGKEHAGTTGAVNTKTVSKVVSWSTKLPVGRIVALLYQVQVGRWQATPAVSATGFQPTLADLMVKTMTGGLGAHGADFVTQRWPTVNDALVDAGVTIPHDDYIQTMDAFLVALGNSKAVSAWKALVH